MSPNRQNLALRQQALASSIFSLDKPEASNPLLKIFSDNHDKYDLPNRLSIYQNNLKATASRALSIAYPVLKQLIGDDTLSMLAQRLLRNEAFTTGDWGDWGENVAIVIHSTELIDDYPFLGDVAEFEWLRHVAGRAKSISFDKESLVLLETNDLGSLSIELDSNITLLSSEYPLDTLWELHQELCDKPKLSEQLKGELQHGAEEYYYMVYSNGFHALHRRLERQEYLWLSSVKSGMNLNKLLTKFHDFDFPRWLKIAIEENFITRFNTTKI